MQTLHIHNIEWDTRPDIACSLPQELTVNINCNNTDKSTIINTIADYLADEYSWCVNGFSVDWPI